MKIDNVILVLNSFFCLLHDHRLARGVDGDRFVLNCEELRAILLKDKSSLSTEAGHVRRLLDAGHLGVVGYIKARQDLSIEMSDMPLFHASKTLRGGDLHPDSKGPFCNSDLEVKFPGMRMTGGL